MVWIRWTLFVLPMICALVACSVGRYQLRHMDQDLARNSPLTWLAEFFVAFFLSFLLTATVAISLSAIRGRSNQLAAMGAVSAVLLVGWSLDAVGLSHGFFSGGMAQFISELPAVIFLFAAVIPSLGGRTAVTPIRPGTSSCPPTNGWRIVRGLLIAIAFCSPLAMQLYIRDRLRLLNYAASALLDGKQILRGPGNQAFFEYPISMSGLSEAIGIFAIGLSAYLMIPLGFAMSTKKWFYSAFVIAATVLVGILDFLRLGQLALTEGGEQLANSFFCIMFFVSASIPYFLFGILTGKMTAVATSSLVEVEERQHLQRGA